MLNLDHMFGVRLSAAERHALRVRAEIDCRRPSTFVRLLIRNEIKQAIKSGELQLPEDVLSELGMKATS